MAKNIGAAEAKARFSELMARVGYGGERFIIERRGRPIAALVGVEDIGRLEREREEASSRAPRGALALVGVWGEVVEDEEIEAMLEDIYVARERDTGRPVDLEA